MRKSGKKPADDDEVEQLLRAAQDDVLLKLNINSHTTRAAAIDPDLDRRFQALKKPSKPAQINNPAKKAPPKPATGASSNSSGTAADGDLFSRFTALKGSIPSHDNEEVKEGEESEDEVEKVIKWAIDAARLDPSPQSTDDDDDQSTDDDDDQSEDDDDGPKKCKRK